MSPFERFFSAAKLKDFSTIECETKFATASEPGPTNKALFNGCNKLESNISATHMWALM